MSAQPEKINEHNKSAPADGQNFKFIENLEGRIRNLALTAHKRENALIPLFETISNAIHSIQDKYPADWVAKGDIRIHISYNSDQRPTSFLIEDNGIGLNGKNWKAFLTYDSSNKILKGGKGVGRLTWLKVFSSVNVDSVYIEEGKTNRRNFDFLLSNDFPIQNYKELIIPDNTPNLTRIYLKDFHDSYAASCPQKTSLICKKIISHFLPLFISEECPTIIVDDATESANLKELLKDNRKNPKEDKFTIEGVGEFVIQHMLLDKSFVGKPEHKIYFAAHGRIVREHIINNQTGLSAAIDFEGASSVYVAVLSSEFFDKSVTQERTNFDIDDDVMSSISKNAEESAKNYLSQPIDLIVEVKSEKIVAVLNKFPRYQHLVKDVNEFARALPLNAKTEEDIYRELSVCDFRKNRETNLKLKNALSGGDPESQKDFEGIFSDLVERVSAQEKSSLADYVVRRKAIIELLDSRLGYIEDENGKRYKEDAIHKIICPIKVTSDDVEADNHNLWLLDDRLAYYRFWASDQSIKTYVQDSTSKDRPDLALFEGCTLFNGGDNSSQPVVIVEFKRPARKEYAEKENPIKQLYKYIKELREKSVSDNKGHLITSIDKDTPFFCYLVCDITPKMEELLEFEQISNRIPGGRGYFGYHKDFKAYIEVIQYSQIVKDARLRNEAFFKELGL